MITLGDYLGHLLSEINNARVAADLQAMNVAKMYAESELLKYLPVPRMRLPKIELDVPVIVSEIQKEDLYSVPSKNNDTIQQQLRSRIAGDVSTYYPSKKIGEKAIDSAFEDVYNLIQRPFSQNDLSPGIIKFAYSIVNMVQGKNRISGPEDKAPQLIERIKAEASKIILENSIVDKERLKQITISPETHRISDVGQQNSILRLKLFISENAMEWTNIQAADGTVSKRLVQE